METFIITLTANEAEVLLKLIDLAVRGGGMSVAEVAVTLTNKIRASAQNALNGKEATNGAHPV